MIVCALLVWRENGAKQLAVQEAEASVKLARANYQQARDTVDRLGARVAEKLADMPGAATLRRSVLEDTLRYYESFIEQSNGDPSLQLDIAVTHTKIDGFKNPELAFEVPCRLLNQRVVSRTLDVEDFAPATIADGRVLMPG